MDSRQKFLEGKYNLILVADGIGPSTYGLEFITNLSIEERRCLGASLGKEEMLRVGADHEVFCKESSELRAKAQNYSSIFNKTMINLMMEKNFHKCDGSNPKTH